MGMAVYARDAPVTPVAVTKVLETVRKYLNGREMTQSPPLSGRAPTSFLALNRADLVGVW